MTRLRDLRWFWRQRVRRSGRRAADALPGRGPHLARNLAVVTGIVKPHPLPLVSIVVPVYRVEDYVAECLDSLVAQTHDNLQIVLVDDGSPDRSIDILHAYARRDPRIEIVTQAHRGVSAARNRGVREARGTFLMFVDPDDLLDLDAVATHVTSLLRTRSDFTVAPYRRFDRVDRWSAGWWIKHAHATRRERVTLTQVPEIQVNAVVWSKCFRRRFWVQHGLAFPEGVLYEDQLVSSRAYALARRFDVLSRPLYNWRVREDQTSTTQQVTDPDILQEFFDAAQSALHALGGSHPGARDARLVQLLRHDLHARIRSAQHAGDAYWHVLRTGLAELTAGMKDESWEQVSVQQRIAVRLVLADLREETTWFCGLGRSNPKRSPAVLAHDRVYLDTPARNVLGVSTTDPVLAFADDQLGLVTSIRGLHWTEDGRFRISAWAYLDNVSLADPATPLEIRVWAEPRGRRTGPQALLPFSVTPTPTAEVTSATKHRYADYERSGFVAELDAQLVTAASRTDGRSTWRIMVEVEAAGIRRSGPLREPYRAGSAGSPVACFVDGREVVPRYGPRSELRLAVSPVRCVVEMAGVSDRVLSVQVQGLEGFVPSEIEVAFPGDAGRVRQSLDRLGEGRAAGQVVLPQPSFRMANETAQGPRGMQRARVRIISWDGTQVPAAVLDPDVLSRQRFGVQHAERTEFGNLCVVDERRLVRIETVAVETTHGLRVNGVLVGLQAENLVLRLESPRAQATAPARWTGPGRFTATIGMNHEPWGSPERPLPSGQYALTAEAENAYGSVSAVAIELERSVLEVLPVVVDSPAGHVRLRRMAHGQLRVDLDPPLGADERGLRHQQQLQDQLGRRLSRPRQEPGSVLFRSNYGEIAGCNQLAIHRELVRRGTDHQLYWAVKDRSVLVPDGGIPVIHESAEWYRLLHEAEFYFDNMHQPIYHRKPAHQVQVQTFHGYPFKQMGMANWARQRREVAHIQSYLDRAKDWDYLVSPATYATAPLCQAFGFDNEVLEIGYPRNDALLGADRDYVRATTRKKLGITDDQQAVLYAPTFRDQLAKDDFRAAMVDFLDIDLLASALGPQHVVLVRGHAFNARRHERIGSSGRIIDVTDYPDVHELMLASDATVLDYSSLRFDYGLTDKPMIFLVPDLEHYLSGIRGAIMPYEPTAPGPLVRSTDEVINALAELELVRDAWASERAGFRRRFLDLDDGRASERLVDRVFFA